LDHLDLGFLTGYSCVNFRFPDKPALRKTALKNNLIENLSRGKPVRKIRRKQCIHKAGKDDTGDCGKTYRTSNINI
jgi:hypothetical protein